MLLAHAKALAVDSVIRGGVVFPKNGPFSNEQLAAEDWEPVEIPYVPPVMVGDCGCGPAAEENTEDAEEPEETDDDK